MYWHSGNRSTLNWGARNLGELPAGETFFGVDIELNSSVHFSFAPRAEGQRCGVHHKFGSCTGELRCRTDVDDSASGVRTL